MYKIVKLFSFIVYPLMLSLVFLGVPIEETHADESITLTTYYPAPYGVYDHMAVNKLKNEGLEPDLNQGYFIGDTIQDIETGRAAGLKTILVFSGKEKPDNKDKWTILPDYTVKDVSGAVDLILNLL